MEYPRAHTNPHTTPNIIALRKGKITLTKQALAE